MRSDFSQMVPPPFHECILRYYFRFPRLRTERNLIRAMRRKSQTSLPELLLSPLLPWRILYANRELAGTLAFRTWQSRYKGSLFNFLWAFLTPLFLLLVYYLAFGLILNLRSHAGNAEIPYALTMFCGMAVYNIFSESVSAACYSVVSQPGYVKKALFDLEVLPFSSFGSSLFSGGIWLAVATAAGLISGRTGLQCRFCCRHICCSAADVSFWLPPEAYFCAICRCWFNCCCRGCSSSARSSILPKLFRRLIRAGSGSTRCHGMWKASAGLS